MLRTKEEMRCGIFHSRVQRKNKSRSPLRLVADYELELFLENGGVSYVNGEAFPVKKGMILCSRPGDERRSDFPVRCFFLRLLPQKTDDACQRLLEDLPRSFYPAEKSTCDSLIPLFAKLESELFLAKEDSDLSLLRINSLLFEILCRVKKSYEGNRLEKENDAFLSAVSEAKEYIHEHFNEDCSLEEIGEAVHLTPNYLHTVFTKQLGISPFAYRNQKRIEIACHLLAAGEKSILQIALETGFCSQSHFSRVFREHCGVTPLQYRKKMLFDY